MLLSGENVLLIDGFAVLKKEVTLVLSVRLITVQFVMDHYDYTIIALLII
jgi:hypothetical protein